MTESRQYAFGFVRARSLIFVIYSKKSHFNLVAEFSPLTCFENKKLQQDWTNPNFFPLPNWRSKCPQTGRFGCHPCS